jgi:2-dehydro-3-deoxy-D-arabinonate dehydratase
VHIIRYRSGGSRTARVGVLIGERVHELPDVAGLTALWALRLDDLKELLRSLDGDGELALRDVTMLPPIDGRTEVWACGVTYKISQQARVADSEQSADVYQRVYDAPRPELFYKSAAWRVVGDGQAIATRSDSILDVPEPEVALVVNAFGEIAGYTVCDDVSSRSIEGENPLYLPQAKVYLGGCALGPAIRPAWEVADPYALAIGLSISRDGHVVWSGTANTSQLHRTYDELVRCLLHSDVYPDGVILSTGTCLVPPAPFSLQHGDIVRIDISDIGTLTTPVVTGLDAIKAASA